MVSPSIKVCFSRDCMFPNTHQSYQCVSALCFLQKTTNCACFRSVVQDREIFIGIEGNTSYNCRHNYNIITSLGGLKADHQQQSNFIVLLSCDVEQALWDKFPLFCLREWEYQRCTGNTKMFSTNKGKVTSYTSFCPGADRSQML